MSGIPVVDVKLPREVTALHALELSSRCSLRCVYCPSPAIVAGKHPKRPALDMTRATFTRALEWVAYYVRRGTQRELNLSGIGEPMLHADLVDFVRLAREAVGSDVKIIFPTNGLHVTDVVAAALAPYRPEIFVSGHRIEKAVPANQVLRRHKIAGGLTADPLVNHNDWAGQVSSVWRSSYEIACPWMREGHAFVYADGRIGHCCLDASGDGALGDVNDPIGSVKLTGWSLCRGCYQKWNIAGVDQSKAGE